MLDKNGLLKQGDFVFVLVCRLIQCEIIARKSFLYLTECCMKCIAYAKQAFLTVCKYFNRNITDLFRECGLLPP